MPKKNRDIFAGHPAYIMNINEQYNYELKRKNTTMNCFEMKLFQSNVQSSVLERNKLIGHCFLFSRTSVAIQKVLLFWRLLGKHFPKIMFANRIKSTDGHMFQVNNKNWKECQRHWCFVLSFFTVQFVFLGIESRNLPMTTVVVSVFLHLAIQIRRLQIIQR